MRRQRKAGIRDIAAEIVRRAGLAASNSHVVRLSEPPTLNERIQLLAARLERRPIVIMPHKCKTSDEWLEQYAGTKGR
jgi:hypothetical protein